MFRYLIAIIATASFFGQAFASDPFTVADVAVDAVGETAIEAQTLAISAGQLQAARIMIDRLTLKAQRETSAATEISQENAAKLIRALEIANEKRSGRRYLGDITVAFNPNAVQAYLRSKNLQMISTQSRPRLVLPVLSGSPLWSRNEWFNAWRGTKYSNALTPIRSARAGQGNVGIITAQQAISGDINALREAGRQFGVNQVLIAETTYGVGTVTATLKDVSLDSGQTRTLGQVSAPTYLLLADNIVRTLEDDWKSASVSMSGKAVSRPVTVLYRSHGEWQRLQRAINGSAQIKDARLDALSKDGALMTITYGGDFERLRTELSFKGLDIREDSEIGLVLSRTGRF